MNHEPDELDRPVQSLHLLWTKLYVPHAHPDVVSRPGLIARLNAGLNRRLILVSAPAGSGKTTLISGWLAQTGLPAAWVSLDTRDNETTRFWSYVVAALQTLQPEAGATVQGMLRAAQTPPIEIILTELLNTIATLTKEFLLVLDDYHAIEAPGIHKGMDFLIANLPPQCHVVIASRSDPPINLPLLRARRQLLEVHPADLRFTIEEASQFLNQIMGLSLSATEVADLEAITEGWIAGLQMAALALESMTGEQYTGPLYPERTALAQPDRSSSEGISPVTGFIRRFSGSHEYIFDYLAQEVLDHQAPEVQDFLLKTAVLERLSSSLCDAVLGVEGTGSGAARTGDKSSLDPVSQPAGHLETSQSILEFIDRSNLFLVPLDQNRQWYRYHHLFADFLQTRLEQQADPETIKGLHRRAREWFEAHEVPAEAIRHAMLAEDFEAARRLLNAFAKGMFERNELVALRGWLKALPEDILGADSHLSMVAAWTLLATGQTGDVERHLHNIERLLGAAADGSPESLALPAEVRGCLSEVCILRASVAFNQLDFTQVFECVGRARRYLSDDAQMGCFNTRGSMLTVSAFNLAIAQEFSGQVTAAGRSFQEALDLSLAEQNPHITSLAYTHLASLQVVQGQLHQAYGTYQEALQKSESSPLPSPLSGTIHTGLGSLLCEWNEIELAIAHFEKGIELGRPWMDWEALVMGFFGLARAATAQGDLKKAFAYLQNLADLTEKFQVAWTKGVLDANRALLQLRGGDLPGALRWARACGINPKQEIPYIQEGIALILARILIAVRHKDEAASLISCLLAGARAGGRQGRLIEALLLHALLSDLQGENEQGLESLGQALHLAEPEGYVRIFIDEGEPVSCLLDRAASRGIFSGYARRLLSVFQQEHEARRSPQPVGGTGAVPKHTANKAQIIPPQDTQLSERELEVLALLAQGLTNQEIADQLIVSLNTVKTHVKNIYHRLDVRNRTEATARARAIGIIE